jgi:hypothetical protein
MVIIWFDDDVIGGGDYDEDSNNGKANENSAD